MNEAGFIEEEALYVALMDPKWVNNLEAVTEAVLIKQHQEVYRAFIQLWYILCLSLARSKSPKEVSAARQTRFFNPTSPAIHWNK